MNLHFDYKYRGVQYSRIRSIIFIIKIDINLKHFDNFHNSILNLRFTNFIILIITFLNIFEIFKIFKHFIPNLFNFLLFATFDPLLLIFFIENHRFDL